MHMMGARIWQQYSPNYGDRQRPYRGQQRAHERRQWQREAADQLADRNVSGSTSMPITTATLPIRVRIGDMPEEEIGTITLEAGRNVYEAVAEALQRAAAVVRERAGLGPDTSEYYAFAEWAGVTPEQAERHLARVAAGRPLTDEMILHAGDILAERTGRGLPI